MSTAPDFWSLITQIWTDVLANLLTFVIDLARQIVAALVT